MKSARATLSKAVILTIATAVLIGITWVAIDFTMSGINAWLMRFESEPPEGWTYWRLQALKRSLPGNALVALVIIAIAFFISRAWYRLLRRE